MRSAVSFRTGVFDSEVAALCREATAAEWTHPYSRELLRSTISLSTTELHSIPGAPPNLVTPPPACRFQPRCPYAWELCAEKTPELYVAGNAGQLARCHLHTPAGAQRLPKAIADHERKMNVGTGID